MKFIITESHFKHYIKVISESDNLNYYDDEDFIEVFFEYFRPWVRENHGKDIGKFPLSYLLKKYYLEFIKSYDINTNIYDDEYWSTRQLVEIGKWFVGNRQHKLPTLLPSHKFTEKFAKQINSIIKSLRLPDWLTFSFTEENPYVIHVRLTVDFEKLMVSDYTEKDAHDFFEEFKEYLETYMGIEFGYPSHGQLEITDDIILKNNERFLDKKFIQKLKSEIKSVPSGDKIHSIKIQTTYKGLHITLSFKSEMNYYSWSSRRGPSRGDIRDSVIEKLKELGFNESKFNVNY